MIKFQDSNTFDDFHLQVLHIIEIWRSETKLMISQETDLPINMQIEFIKNFSEIIAEQISSDFKIDSRISIIENIESFNKILSKEKLECFSDGLIQFNFQSNFLLIFLLCFELRYLFRIRKELEIENSTPLESFNSILLNLNSSFPHVEINQELNKSPNVLQENIYEENNRIIREDLLCLYQSILPNPAIFYLENHDSHFHVTDNPVPFKNKHEEELESIDSWLLKENIIASNYDWILESNYHNKRTRINQVAALIHILKSNRKFSFLKRTAKSKVVDYFATRYRLIKKERKSLLDALKTEKIEKNKYTKKDGPFKYLLKEYSKSEKN